MARLSRHDQAHRLTVKGLGRVDSHYVPPFESKFGLTSYRKNPPRFSTYYIRLKDRQYLTLYLRATSTFPLGVEVLCKQEEIDISCTLQVHYVRRIGTTYRVSCWCTIG